MPEIPDLEVYLHALRPRIDGRRLEGIRLRSPFLLRSVSPPLADCSDHRLVGLQRLGKRLVFALEGDLYLVLHLMIAGRLSWKRRTGPAAAPASIPKRRGLVGFDFTTGTLILTEAGSKKRASLHVVRGMEELAKHDPGGIEPLDAPEREVGKALQRENHTVKRALTDPRILAGIGNAYSDEILHRARLSPFKRTRELQGEELGRLVTAIRKVLEKWTDRLITEVGDGFPKKVTAFRPDMAVHGRYGLPCPACGAPVQRIIYAASESNYCPGCQTDGKILADRVLSKLMKNNWPSRLEDLEHP